jgi:hypothetical protein
MVMSHLQDAGQNRNLLSDNKSFKNMTKFKYVGTIGMNQNLIHKEIKSMLNLENVYYHLAQNLLSSCLLSNNLKIKHKLQVYPLFCMGVKPGLSLQGDVEAV